MVLHDEITEMDGSTLVVGFVRGNCYGSLLRIVQKFDSRIGGWRRKLLPVE